MSHHDEDASHSHHDEPPTADAQQTPGEAETGGQRFPPFLPPAQQDDGVHRMALRAGQQPLPEDRDALAYADDQGEHAVVARHALATGDVRRSIYHLILALAEDPEREEWLALLEAWITAADSSALELVPLDDPAYFPTLHACQTLMQMGNTPEHRMEVIPVVGPNYHAKVAVHAFILLAQGQASEGVTLFLQLEQFQPHIPYITWLTRWLDRPDVVNTLDPTRVAALVARRVRDTPGVYLFSPRLRKELGRYLPILRACLRTFPSHTVNEHLSNISFVYLSILRRVGLFEEAAQAARTFPASYQTRVSLAIAEAAVGNRDAGSAAYHEALSFEPNDVAVRNDLGKLSLHFGRLAEALAYYEESVRLDPTDPFQQAQAYCAYLRALLTSSSEPAEMLRSLAHRQQTASRLLFLLQAPPVGSLPAPREALIELMRMIKTHRATGDIELPADGTVTVSLQVAEAPSAYLAARRMLHAWGYNLAVTVSEPDLPDPRVPLREMDYQLWRYEAWEPLPTVPTTPNPVIAAQLATLAQTPYALIRWYAQAHELGQRLGEEALADLLAAMVYPPDTPVGWEEWDWMMAIQFASALTIASLGEEHRWEDTPRRGALRALVYGPPDWSGAAALSALAVLANQKQQIAIELDAICCDLWSQPDRRPAWFLEQAMVAGLLFVNHYSEQAGASIKDYFEQEEQKRTRS